MKHTPIRRVSKKRATELRQYSKIASDFLMANPKCQVCGDPAQAVHHKRGRGIYLNRVEYFMACCNACHDRVHRSPGWARSQGFLLCRIGHD